MGSESGRFLGFFLLMVPVWLVTFSSSSQALKFDVGGKDGWVVKPSEGYDHWAKRNRFQVNDTLYFKYKKGSDSVLVVNKDDYYSCNTDNPTKKMDDGDSTFTLEKSGPFFFISGNSENCKRGQKLVLVVMAEHKRPAPTPAAAPPPLAPSPKAPTPEAAPPSLAPPPKAPTPAAAPPSLAPSPKAAESPKAESPGSGMPQPSQEPSGLDAPAPSPKDGSGSTRFGGSDTGVGVALLSVTIGVILMFIAQ